MHHTLWFVAHTLCSVVLTLGGGTLLVPDPAFAQNPPGDAAVKPIEPEEPLRAILAAFDSHDIVALDEGRHGNEQGHELRLKLIRHPLFARRVNDIVVEFGSARYQELMDRYIRGEDVAAGELRRAWQDTTQHAVWDVPIYEEFFRAVRQVNESLPKDRQLRVLLADPPIDWAVVKTASDHLTWLRMRDTFGAALVQREVLGKKRKALLIFGASHLQRKNISANYEPLEGAETVISILDRAQAKIFTIRTPTEPEPAPLQADMASWPVPSLALLRGTRLGTQDAAPFWSTEMSRFAVRDGKPSPLPRDQWRVLPMQDLFDALLYLGPAAKITTAKLPAAVCADTAYRQMRRDRMLLLNHKAQADQFDRDCGNQPAK